MNDPEVGYFVLDASVWVSRLVPQDGYHASVKAWMERQRSQGQRFLSPGLLLPEVAGAIARRTGDAGLAQRAVSRLQTLPGLRLVEMDSSLTEAAAHLAADLGLRGADAVYVATALALKLPLVTLDRDQRGRAAPRVAIQDLER